MARFKRFRLDFLLQNTNLVPEILGATLGSKGSSCARRTNFFRTKAGQVETKYAVEWGSIFEAVEKYPGSVVTLL